jgi:hypothetical protein
MSSAYDLSNGGGWPVLIRAHNAGLLEEGARLADAYANMYGTDSDIYQQQSEHARKLREKAAELRAQNRTR